MPIRVTPIIMIVPTGMSGTTATVGTAGTTIGIPTGKQKLEEKERCIT